MEKRCTELWFEIKDDPEKVKQFIASTKNIKQQAELLNMDLRIWTHIKKHRFGIESNISKREHMLAVVEERLKHERRFRLPTPEEYHKRFGSETMGHDVG